MREIDAKGLACPAPVIQTKAVIQDEKPDWVNVIVDNEAASQNISRFLHSQHYEEVTISRHAGEFHVQGKRQDMIPSSEPAPQPQTVSDRKKILVMVGVDKLGKGDDELGEKLMISFLKTLNEMGPDLWRLVFVNSGVKLTIENATVLEDLKHLEETGVHIFVCGTCLDHFNLLEKKQVGETTNMLDIVTSLQLADTVINI